MDRDSFDTRLGICERELAHGVLDVLAEYRDNILEKNPVDGGEWHPALHHAISSLMEEVVTPGALVGLVTAARYGNPAAERCLDTLWAIVDKVVSEKRDVPEVWTFSLVWCMKEVSVYASEIDRGYH